MSICKKVLNLSTFISNRNVGTPPPQKKNQWIKFHCLSNYCLTPYEKFVSYIMTRTSYIWWDDTRFAFDQHAGQLSAGRHVAPLGQIILILNQPAFGLTRPGLEPTIYRTPSEHANH